MWMRTLESPPQSGDYIYLYFKNLKTSLLSPKKLISTHVPQILYFKNSSEEWQ